MTWFADDVVKVEVRFDGSTWVNLSSPTNYVILSEPLQIDRGRDDEFADPMNPGVLELLLVNDDGRFTPDLPSSPYYPYVVPDVATKVSVYVNGAWQARFYGSVQSWSVRLGDEGGYTSTCAVTAGGALGAFPSYLLRQPSDEVVRERTGALYHWPLRDSDAPISSLIGSAELSSNGADGLGSGTVLLEMEEGGDQHPLFNSATGGLTLSTQGNLPNMSHPCRLDIVVLSKPTANGTILSLTGGGSTNSLMWSSTVGFYFTSPGSGTATGVPASWPVVVEMEALTGVGAPGPLRCATVSGLVGTTVAFYSVPFRQFSINPTLSGGAAFSIGQVGIFTGAGSDSEFAAFAAKLLGPRIPPTMTAVSQLSAWAGGPSIAGGTAGDSYLPEIGGRDAADAVGAVLTGMGARVREEGDGTLTQIPFPPSTAAISLPAEKIHPDITWETSDVGWVSDCTVERGGLTYTATRTDGRRQSYSIDGVHATWIQDRSYADWLVNTANTKARLSQAIYDVSSLSATDQATVAGIKIGDRITISSLPSTILPASLTLIVEGITDSISDDGWTVTLKTSPDVYSRLLIWDNSQNWDDGWIWAP